MGKLADTLEAVVGVLAVLGFISLRTHLTLLGVSWDTSLGTEKYLVEAYQLVSAGLAVVLDYLPLLMKICLPLLVVAFALRGTKIGTRVKSLWPKKEWKPRYRLAVPLCLILLSIGVYLAASRDLHSELMAPYNGQLVGIEMFNTHYVFSAVVVFCVVGYLVYSRQARNEEDRLVSLAWYGFMGTLLVLGFYLTMYYGAALRDSTYPVAKVGVKNAHQPYCGLLVLQSDKTMVLWRAVPGSKYGGAGQVIAIPDAEVFGVSLGPAQDLKIIVNDAMDGKFTMPCNQIPDPTEILGMK